MIQVGSIVMIARMDSEGAWNVPEGSIEGTVIGLEADDCDGRDTIESLTIRWSDGRVETCKPEGDDDTGGWEVYDATPTLYANLYLYDRAYGGSEEGGWFYDTYSPVSRDSGDWDTEPPAFGWFASVDEAYKASEALKAWCDIENRTRRSPSSVLSEGHYCVHTEEWPAEPMPARKPHYC